MTGSTGDVSFLPTTPPALPVVSGRKVGETLVALKGRLKTSRWGRRPFGAHPGSMPSLVALAKRALVAALKSVARSYGVRVDLTGEQMWRGREGLLSGTRQGSSWVGSEPMWSPPGASSWEKAGFVVG